MGIQTTPESLASDTDIIRKIINGEHPLFEILMRRYNSLLYKIGRSYGISHEDVQDLMQETYLAAFRNLQNFEGRSGFKTWLVRIMLNKCIDWNRKAVNRSDKSGFGFTDSSDAVAPASDARHEILNRELGRVLEKMIEELPYNYRTVFVLRELDGMTVPETAEALHISESNVKVRLNRAKALLRKKLESWYPLAQVYEFNQLYCDRIVDRVFRQL